MDPQSPVQFVKGVGPVRAAQLATLNIHTVRDLLEYFPFRYEDHSGRLDIADIPLGATVTIQGEVISLSGRPPGLRAEVHDGTGSCFLRWFDRQNGGQRIRRGATVIATGRVQEFNGEAEIVQPNVQVFPAGTLIAVEGQARRVGVYRGNAQAKSALVRRAIDSLLSHTRLPVAEVLPESIRRARQLSPRADAIRQIHRPSDDETLERARRQLAYEEMFLMELVMAMRRRKRKALHSGYRLTLTPEIDQRIRARFPFPLTPAQERVVREIAADLASGRPMTRLLQGDVGSGKTVVALHACLAAIAHGRQAAIMAPTELVAQQHFGNVEKYLAGSRVRRVLLSGGLSAAARSAVLQRIERGEVDLVVGTQALIQSDVAFASLALVVVDEQHKFGVLQRHAFRTKGPMPHYLVMTATPIPRTLAMTVFGDLDVSVIDRAPPGRGKVETRVVPAANWTTVMRHVRGRLERGEQAYVVCPLIGELPGDEPNDEPAAGEKNDLITARAELERLSSGPFAGLNIELLHGALSASRKQSVIGDFAAGRLHAVVATTVVEVGIDVANATIMIVEHAERFGLSQLHQLRGRVGRGRKDSLCILISHGSHGKAGERLAAIARTTDGFRIAEADLKLRGPGQLFGTRQHGLPELRVASLVKDFELLEQARQDAFRLIEQDPQLARPEHAPLWPALQRVFGDKLSLIDAA